MASKKNPLLDEVGQTDKLKQRIKQLEKTIALQNKKIDDQLSSNYTFRPKFRKKQEKGSFVRVIIPDTHGSHIDPAAAGAFLSDFSDLRPREVVLLGDHLDAGGWLAQHHTMGFVAETENTFQDDVGAANQFLDDLQSRAPKATYHYLEGNHEHRLEKWCVTQTLRNRVDAEYLRKLCGCEAQLNLEKREINFYRRSQKYFGLKHYGVIKLGHCYFVHGNSTAKHAASAMLIKYGGNVVYGHTHRADDASQNTVAHGMIKAWSPGCLCILQPLWLDTNPANWNHGYGVQLVQSDGSFLHINVPIIDGKSYLLPFIERFAA